MVAYHLLVAIGQFSMRSTFLYAYFPKQRGRLIIVLFAGIVDVWAWLVHLIGD